MSEIHPSGEQTTWHDVCGVDEIEPGDARVLSVVPPVAIFNLDGDLYATDDTCTHAESSLADGYIEGDTVECAFHFAKFCIRTGAALTRPAVIPLATYPVRTDGDRVQVDLASR